MITIEKLTEKDIAEIAELDKLCFSVPWSYNSFLAELQNPIARYLVAKHSGRCIGYCGFWVAYDCGDITNIAVHPDYRRRGIGSMLVSSMLSLARNESLGSMNLEVRRSNIAAQNLYSKYGFEIMGTRKGYYSDNHEDALIMVVSLED